MEQTFIVKISKEIEVKTTTEVSARRVVMDNTVLPLRNTKPGQGIDIESITVKEDGPES